MELKKLLVLLAVFSILFWADFFMSLGQAEMNPLYSPTNKLIFYPVIVISVFLLNGLWGNARLFKAVPIFLVVLFSFAFVWNLPVAFAQASDFNGGFEDVASTDNSYSYTNNFLFGACSSDVRSVETPVGWTISSNQVGSGGASTNSFDNKKIVTGFNTEGVKGLAMWYISPNSCEYNVSTVIPANVTQGITVTALSPLINVSSNQISLSFDIAPLNFYPIKCDSFLCTKKFYGNTCGVLSQTGGTVRDDVDEEECNAITNGVPRQIDGSVRVEILYPNATQIVYSGSGLGLSSVPSQSFFTTKTVDLSQFLPSGTSQINIRFIVYQPSTTDRKVAGFVVDNVEITDNAVVESPANQYVTDMTNLTAFPATISHDYTTAAFAESSFVSQKFNGVALGYLKIQRTAGTCTTGGGNHVESPIVYLDLVYRDGSRLDVKNFSYHDNFASGADWATNVGYPMVRPENLDHIEMKLQPSRPCGGTFLSVNITHNPLLASVRQTYSNSLSGVETFQGLPDLFPFVVYQNRVSPNGTQAYSIHNLAFQPQTLTGSQLFFILRGASGILKNIGSDTKAVPSAFSLSTNTFAPTFFPQPLGYFNSSTDWFSGTPAESGDTIIVVSNSTKAGNGTSIPIYTSNTTVTFDPSNTTGFGGCVDMCVGTTFRDAFQSSFGGNVSVCSFTFVPDAEQCVFVPPTQIGGGFGGNITDPIGGDATQEFLNQNGIGWLGVFLTPLFFIFIIIVGIGGFLEYKIPTRGIVFLATLLSLVLLVTFLGVFPIEVAILVIIIAGALLANQVRQFVGGGQVR